MLRPINAEYGEKIPSARKRSFGPPFVIAIVLLASLFVGASPTTAVTTLEGSNISVVYIFGTKGNALGGTERACGGGDFPFELQDSVGELNRRILTWMGADNRNTMAPNYYCKGTRVRDDAAGKQVPYVPSVVGYPITKPDPICLGPTSRKWDGGRPDEGVESVMIHAYRLAHYLSWYVSKNPTRRLLLIGHSQGGMLARMIYLLSDPSHLDPKILTGKIAPKCWPRNLKEKISGVVTMGAPHSGISTGGVRAACSASLIDPGVWEICSLADPLSVNRRFTEKWKKVSLPRTITAGGYNEENTGTLGLVFRAVIPWESSTALKGIKLGVMGAPPFQKQEHEWWMVTGQCVKSNGFCYYTDAPTWWNPSTKKIYKLGSRTVAGDIYDLLVNQMKSAWGY